MYSDFIHNDSLIDHLTGSKTKKCKHKRWRMSFNAVLVTENLYHEEQKAHKQHRLRKANIAIFFFKSQLKKQCRICREQISMYIRACNLTTHTVTLQITLLYTLAKISFCIYKSNSVSSRGFNWIGTRDLEKSSDQQCSGRTTFPSLPSLW